MQKKIYLLALLMASSFFSLGQIKRKHHFPIWTYHQKNVNIDGISVGIYSGDEHRNTNGIKLEALGLGIILPLAPRDPMETNYFYARKVIKKN